MQVVHAFSSPVADATGTLTIWNGATTASVIATENVRPGDWNSAHNLRQDIAGNTAGVSSVSGTNIVWAGGNNVTLSANGATVSVHGADTTQFLTTAALSNHSHGNPTLALTNLTGTTASNSAGLTLSLSAGDLGAFLTTAALSNHSHGNPTLALTNISGTTASNSAGLTLSLSAGAGGGAAPITYSNTQFAPVLYNQIPSGLIVPGLNSVYLVPIHQHEYVTGAALRLPCSITANSSATNSGQRGFTYQVGLYTRNATNDTVLMSHWTTSYTIGASYSSNVSMMYSLITAVGNSTSYSTTALSSGGVGISASVSGFRELVMPYSTLMTPGDYWLAFARSSSNGGTPGNVLAIDHLAHTLNNRFAMGVASNVTSPGFARDVGLGTYSATSAALPDSISMTQINMVQSVPVFYWGTNTQ